jgi:hypothetical protein
VLSISLSSGLIMKDFPIRQGQLLAIRSPGINHVKGGGDIAARISEDGKVNGNLAFHVLRSPILELTSYGIHRQRGHFLTKNFQLKVHGSQTGNLRGTGRSKIYWMTEKTCPFLFLPIMDSKGPCAVSALKSGTM